jgi:hypothetical protein
MLFAREVVIRSVSVIHIPASPHPSVFNGKPRGFHGFQEAEKTQNSRD